MTRADKIKELDAIEELARIKRQRVKRSKDYYQKQKERGLKRLSIFLSQEIYKKIRRMSTAYNLNQSEIAEIVLDQWNEDIKPTKEKVPLTAPKPISSVCRLQIAELNEVGLIPGEDRLFELRSQGFGNWRELAEQLNKEGFYSGGYGRKWTANIARTRWHDLKKRIEKDGIARKGGRAPYVRKKKIV